MNKAVKDELDMNKKLTKWEQFYNFNCAYEAFDCKTPYEALNTLLQ